MPRGGRGDVRGGGGGGRARAPLPPGYDDEGLYEAAEQAMNDDSGDDMKKELFPDVHEWDWIMAAPITDAERQLVEAERESMAERRAGPFWTGSREQWAEADGKSGGSHNPFEDAATYGNKRKRKTFQLADLRKVKGIHPEFFPKELQSVVKHTGEDDLPAVQRKKKRLAFAKKSTADKLANITDKPGEDDAANADSEQDAEDDGDDEEDDVESDDDELARYRDPADDDEDDDDDYNAERYYDNGEEDFEKEGAGEDYVAIEG